ARRARPTSARRTARPGPFHEEPSPRRPGAELSFRAPFCSRRALRSGRATRVASGDGRGVPVFAILARILVDGLALVTSGGLAGLGQRDTQAEELHATEPLAEGALALENV